MKLITKIFIAQLLKLITKLFKAIIKKLINFQDSYCSKINILNCNKKNYNNIKIFKLYNKKQYNMLLYLDLHSFDN